VLPSDNLLSFNIPPALRKQLLDDFEFVTQMQKVFLSACYFFSQFSNGLFCVF